MVTTEFPGLRVESDREKDRLGVDDGDEAISELEIPLVVKLGSTVSVMLPSVLEGRFDGMLGGDDVLGLPLIFVLLLPEAIPGRALPVADPVGVTLGKLVAGTLGKIVMVTTLVPGRIVESERIGDGLLLLRRAVLGCGESDVPAEDISAELELMLIDGVDGGTVGSVGTPVMNVVNGPDGGFAPPPVPVTTEMVELLAAAGMALELMLIDGLDGGIVGTVGTPVTTMVRILPGGFAPPPVPVTAEVGALVRGADEDIDSVVITEEAKKLTRGK